MKGSLLLYNLKLNCMFFSTGQRRSKFGDPSLDRFCLIHPCDRQTDRQTELRWLRRAESIAAFARKKDRTQKVTQNALPTQTPFLSSHIDQILLVGSYPGHLSWFWVSLKSVENVGAMGDQNFGLSIDLAHRLYNSLLLLHKPWKEENGKKKGEEGKLTVMCS